MVKESVRSSYTLWIAKKDSKGIVDQIEKIYEALDYLFFDSVDFAVNMSGLKADPGADIWQQRCSEEVKHVESKLQFRR